MNYAGFLQLAAKSGNARARYFGVSSSPAAS
jgi:hypothetical protein